MGRVPGGVRCSEALSFSFARFEAVAFAPASREGVRTLTFTHLLPFVFALCVTVLRICTCCGPVSVARFRVMAP